MVESHGAESPRASFPVVWPSRLLLPQRPPALVYLDLNHFIYLARVAMGSTAPRGYDSLLRACRDAIGDGSAVFPLSATHYMEMARFVILVSGRQSLR